MPIHDHGNNVYKDLAALTDMTLKKHKYEKLYPDVEQSEDSTLEEVSYDGRDVYHPVSKGEQWDLDSSHPLIFLSNPTD